MAVERGGFHRIKSGDLYSRACACVCSLNVKGQEKIKFTDI